MLSFLADSGSDSEYLTVVIPEFIWSLGNGKMGDMTKSEQS